MDRWKIPKAGGVFGLGHWSFVNVNVKVNEKPRLEILFTFTRDVHEKLDG